MTINRAFGPRENEPKTNPIKPNFTYPKLPNPPNYPNPASLFLCSQSYF
jgi:hypothetical protein